MAFPGLFHEKVPSVIVAFPRLFHQKVRSVIVALSRKDLFIKKSGPFYEKDQEMPQSHSKGPTQCSMRKGHRRLTVTRHQEDN